jgi:Flp pilus assembly protein TadG
VTARATPATVRRRNKGHFGHKGHFDRGAAAVEMALVMPLLLAMIIGIIDFSRIFNAELQLSQAAREGARLASLLPQTGPNTMNGTDLAAIQARARLAAPNPAFGAALPLSGVTVVPTYCTSSPAATDVATVRVDYLFNGIYWMNGTTLSQTARMRCGG